MEKIRLGVLGIHRGAELIQYCKAADNAELVAVCDSWDEGLQKLRQSLGEHIRYYTAYEDFLKCPMDAVVLANDATKHAPFAIRAMECGLDVLCEVLPCQTLREAVELVETAEKTGRKYCYLENFCYMPAPAEMRRLYREGKIGEFRYGEGEYIHNCETLCPDITYGEHNHWRNNIHANFYCTHSLGPILHCCGLRPVSVTGFELPYANISLRMGCKSGLAGIGMVTLENGAVVKSAHGNLYRNSIWYSVYGDKGRMESAREDADCGDVSRLYVSADSYEGEYAPEPVLSYRPTRPNHWDSNGFGHARADYYVMWNAIEHLRGNPEADIIDVYEALDMALPGLFAYFSVLAGGIPMKIPNLRDRSAREEYRNDTRCTDSSVAGEQLLPCYSKGNPEIPDIVYQAIREEWEEHRKLGRCL